MNFVLFAVATVSVVYFSIGFVLSVRSGMARRNEQLREIAEFMDLPESEWFEDAAPLVLDEIIPFVRSVQLIPSDPVWVELTPEQLRKECQARSIRWRNAHGKNRHLKKAEMVAALGAIAA